MTNVKGYVSQAPSWVHTPGVGAIWLVRDNEIVKDYADTRVSESDYGAGLQQALSDAVAFDKIICGPGRFQGTDILADAPDVTIIFHDTELLADSATYDQIFHVGATALRNRVIGLRTRDSNPAVTGEGAGIRVNGNQSQILNCSGYGHKGTTSTKGYGLWCIGADLEIRGYYAEDCQYTGIRSTDANRLLIADSYLVNNGTGSAANRCMQIEGSLTMDSVTITNTKCLSNVADTGALINISTAGYIAELRLHGVQIINKDQISSGISYDTPNREQCLKVQRVGALHISDCSFRHGTNQGAGGYVTGMAMDEPAEQLYITNSNFSDGCSLISNSNRNERTLIQNCRFGLDQAELPGSLFVWAPNGRHVSFINNEFNCHSAFRCFSFTNENAQLDDVLEIVGNTFVGDKDANQSIADDTDGGSNLQTNPRRMIVSDNVFVQTNVGGFEFRPSDWETTFGSEELNLSMSTDRNGDLMWDSTRVGSGPTEGFPAAPFTQVNGRKGQRIIDVSWSGTGTRVWQFGGTAWAPVP